MQLGAYGAVSASASYVGVGSNSYASGSIGWGSPKYLGSGHAPLYLQQVSNGQHQWFTSPSGTAGNAITFTQAMTLDASANLMVNRTSVLTNSKVSVDGSLGLNGASGDGVLRLYTAGTQYGGIASAAWAFGGASSSTDLCLLASNNLVFGAGGADRGRFDSSGNLLVGTTSATNKRVAAVVGNSVNTTGYYAESGSSYTGGHFLGASATAAGTGWYHFVGQSSGGTNNILIFGNGNVQNANNSYGAISDAKLKENIVDASPKLDKLMQVRVRNYNLIGDYENHKQLGVVAQELETVFPSMVEETADRDAEGNALGTTTKSVKYSVFVPMLIKAIQEQQALITQLQADVAALKA